MNNTYRVLVKSVSPPAKTIQRVVYNPSSFCAVTNRKQIPMLLCSFMTQTLYRKNFKLL
jgi:hypothetical protein